MAELSFNQITEKLNTEFADASEGRKLIFWYDEHAEFVDEVDQLALTNAKVLHLEKDNQFHIKYFLERDDTTTNYLVYAPFAKPGVKENHLADTILYSKEFFADRASLICLDLGIREQLKPVIQKYIKFFAAKQRTQQVYAMNEEVFRTEDSIEDGLMSVLCKCKLVSFEEVVRTVLTEGTFEDNKYLAELDRYGLTEAFWRHVANGYGYTDTEPTLEKFAMCLFVTYAGKTIHSSLPTAWKPFESIKAGNIQAFLDNLMNSTIYGERFDEISAEMANKLDADKYLRQLPVESLIDCSLFAKVDEIILDWLTARLMNSEFDAKLEELSLPDVASTRSKLHFGQNYINAYAVLQHAFYILRDGHYTEKSGVKNIVSAYTSETYKIDQHYRLFNLNYDRMENTEKYSGIYQKVEQLYTYGYLDGITRNFAMELSDAGITSVPLQTDFYNDKLRYAKERIVVIISDAFRYEVGRSLLEKLSQDEKCDAKLSAMQSFLPSITSYGMAALLPHKKLEIDNSFKVTLDGKPCDTLQQREAILQAARPASCCVRYDDLKGLSKQELRDIIAGKDIVYVYHNQVDARGDKASTENEVFVACEEAVNEISALIRRLTTCANTKYFIVTADHGFIYRRSKLTAGDKISGMENPGKRYAITDHKVSKEGVISIPMSKILGSDDSRYYTAPMGTDLFTAPGSGLNYVHGGCSPQEMIIPLLEVKTEKAKVETTNAQISLVAVSSKITNLMTSLDFVQKDPVSDVIKETSYRVYFVDSNGTRISNEVIINADKKDTDTLNRMFRVKFSLRNQVYSSSAHYYLVAFDEKTGLEAFRHEYRIDIAFADDYGF